MCRKLSRPAIEYNLTEHCNLRCAHCDHASPLLPQRLAELDSFVRDLTVLAKVLHCEELKFLGGEPLMHTQLIEFLKEGRASGVADTLTLVTNGVLLHRVDDVIFRFIDKLWVNLYPTVKIRADFKKLHQLAIDCGVKLKIRRIKKFRQTLINGRHQRPETVQQIYRHCGLAHTWSCHTIYEGFYYKCPPAPFLEPRLARRGVLVKNRIEDGVPLHDNPRLREQLAAYLASTTPLGACFYCLGTSGREFRHYQLDESGVRDAIQAKHPIPGELVDPNLLRRARREFVRLTGYTGG